MKKTVILFKKPFNPVGYMLPPDIHMGGIMEDFLAILETIPDPRADKGKLHNLAEIIVMSLYGLLCGAVRSCLHKK